MIPTRMVFTAEDLQEKLKPHERFECGICGSVRAEAWQMQVHFGTNPGHLSTTRSISVGPFTVPKDVDSDGR